jgi:hypothetical protein
MKTLTCDICRSAIQAPSPGRNYYHVAHRDVCESCHDKLEYQIKPVVRTKSPFDYNWFVRLFQENVEKAIQKGKVDVKIAP